jgi:hypothetical protein
MVRTLAAALFAVVAAAVQAAEPVPLESLAAPLLQAQTYCGIRQVRLFHRSERPATPAPLPRLRPSRRALQVCRESWADLADRNVVGRPHAASLRRIRPQLPAAGSQSAGADHFYDKPGEKTPALHSRVLRQVTRSGAGLDLLGSLRDYRVNPDLSDARQTVYERTGDDRRGGTRIFVAADGARHALREPIRRVVRGYIEIAERQVGLPLEDAISPTSTGGLRAFRCRTIHRSSSVDCFVLTALAGTVFWAWRFRRAEHWYDVVSDRAACGAFRLGIRQRRRGPRLPRCDQLGHSRATRRRSPS